MFCVDVRTVGFAVSFRSCRAIQGVFLLLAMLCSYLVSDTWSLPSLSRSTGDGLVVTSYVPRGGVIQTVDYNAALDGYLQINILGDSPTICPVVLAKDPHHGPPTGGSW